MTRALPSGGRGVREALSNAVQSWLRPRATERDVAFRERIIRSTVALLTGLLFLSLSLNIFVYHGAFTLVSHYTMHIITLLGLLCAGGLVARGRIIVAGWLLVLSVLFAVSSLVLLARQAESVGGIVNGLIAFMFVPLVAALVLPRNLIVPISLFSAMAYAVSQYAIPINDFTLDGVSADQQVAGVLVALLGVGFLLRQLRGEFDDRLESMHESYRQMALAREEAEDARLRAEDADRAKSQFLANMSHELRTPLNAIIGYDEIMIGGMVGEFTPKQKDLLVRIQLNSHRLLNLINEVLDLSKIEAGSVEIYQAPMSPRKVITETIAGLNSLALQKDIRLTVDIQDTLPEMVFGDANKIQQILVNLVSNAIKFTDHGGVTVTACAVDVSHWQLEVRDTGIGIPQEALALIFEPFRQVDSSVTRRHKGSGLGLSISGRLAKRMGGTMEVKSVLGQGSTFTVTLPRVSVSEPAAKSASELVSESASESLSTPANA